MEEVIPSLKEVHKLFHNLKMELEQHLIKEEEIEFPLMKEDEKQENFPGREKILQVIQELKAEHDAAGELLRQLRKVTNDYELPGDACHSYRVAYGKLEELENDIFQHVHLENNILFPRYQEN